MAKGRTLSEDYHKQMSTMTLVSVIAIVAIILMGIVVKFAITPQRPANMFASPSLSPSAPVAGQAAGILPATVPDPTRTLVNGVMMVTKSITKKTWPNSPAARIPDGIDRSRLCLNLDTLKDADGFVTLTTQQQIYDDDQGLPAITICPYEFSVARVDIQSANLNIYCLPGAVISGPGDANTGFLGYGSVTQDGKIHNCVIQNFQVGIESFWGDAYNNTINVSGWGIEGLMPSSSKGRIMDNTISAGSGGIANTYRFIEISGNTIMPYKPNAHPNGMDCVGYGLIQNNHIFGATYYGIFDGSGDAQTTIIRNNEIHAVGYPGLEYAYGIGIHSALYPSKTSIIEGNTITSTRKGIEVNYGQISGDISFTIRSNAITGTGPAFYGIEIDGRNRGYGASNGMIQSNTITGIAGSKNIYLHDDIQQVHVRDNILSGPVLTNIDCFRGAGIEWTCNSCGNGIVTNNQCNPAAFCQHCNQPPSQGGSPFKVKETQYDGGGQYP